MSRSIQKFSNKSPQKLIEWLNCGDLALPHWWNTWSFSRWMKPDGDKERKKCMSCCPVCLCAVKMKTWLHQKWADLSQCPLAPKTLPARPDNCPLVSLFFVSMQTFDAVGEWCHFWSTVLKRWKCLPWGNHVLLHRAQLLFSHCALQLARAVFTDNKIFTLQGHLSYTVFCQFWHLRA